MHNLTKIRIFRIALWMTYPLACVLLYPFAVLRKRNPGGLFFLFDRYSIGGAQRIHLDILHSIPDFAKQVWFTRQSPNDKLKETFYSVPGTDNYDIHRVCDWLLFRLFSVHYFSFYINRHNNAHVLSSNSTFFYDMLPFLNKRVIKTELLHNFSFGPKGMEFFGLANHELLTYRIVYDSFTLSNIRKQYAEYRVPSLYLDRILFIEPGVDYREMPTKTFDLPLRILYAGRGGPQKRVWLLNSIAEEIIKQQLPVQFQFAGPMANELSELVKQHSVIHGEVSEKTAMDAIYAACHVIMLTSAYEGFPMVIKEGMINGCIPLVTALEGNLMHLKNLDNALLIEAIEDEDAVIAQGIAQIKWLVEHHGSIAGFSLRAYQYAATTFDKKKFQSIYRGFLLDNDSSGGRLNR
ncbi:MAG TPA: glycosyltransferase [Flavitalea sp.]|nr:glycosyltransferase [Flavitalea sp.]